MVVLYYTVIALSAALCIISVVPLIRNDYWVFRVFEFPRAQKWVINLVLVLAFAAIRSWYADALFWYVLAALIINQAYLTYQILPFTFLAQKQIHNNRDPSRPSLRLLISNVYQPNRKGRLLINELKKCDAEVIIFVETDEWWKDTLVEAFSEDFPHRVLKNLENTYGMLLFSRYELEDTEVRYKLKDNIPSIRTILKHPKAGKIQLFAVHPEPPIPSENPYSTARDGEMLLTGEEAKQSEYPVIVAGDLNDVAWSYTTALFLKTSELLDPRRGRGLYSTFHAEYPFFRWPLDHIFCSAHFQLNKMKCLPYVGSDHLPIYVDFAVLKQEDQDQEPLEADEADFELADEKIEAAEEVEEND